MRREASLDSTREPTARGRFAPSPTGPLHFGSLLAALASYLDARHAGAAWLVRMEDLDPPRAVPGAADAILRTLEALGLRWDGHVMHQSERGDAYQAAVDRLTAAGLTFVCGCSRRDVAELGDPGPEGPVYPGTCRNGLPSDRKPRSVRMRVGHHVIRFHDRLQGAQIQDLARDVGDFVIRRADGPFSYHLAVVVDDGAQGITDVVRGADLIRSTGRQILLQESLGLPHPRYLHIPVAVDPAGRKLGKSLGSPAIAARHAGVLLRAALDLLGQRPPDGCADPAELLAWAVRNWNPGRLPATASVTVDPDRLPGPE
ncbi:MAG TPA: tRNA glutamyl-Q(34) synthetase GluQRS [Gammaproteobacteria bacterium]|nr:tRNA glutamyl-Q(34) synthetase GluQRS [Gammaproteobacteria bacterium]